MDLKTLGWNDFFVKQLTDHESDGYSVARVILGHREYYRARDEQGEVQAQISGKMRFLSQQTGLWPVIGDWVLIRRHQEQDTATIDNVLQRKSKFSRQIAGSTTSEQIIAANIDTVFLVAGLDNNLNLRRLERYLMLVWQSGSSAIIVLNKADLASDVEEQISQVEAIALGVPIIATSVESGQGIEDLRSRIAIGQTVALLGSSGVGKSSLVNTLLGRNQQAVQAVRASDDRGRHTTTHKELFLLPQGGLVIDTPGMRELQLWGSEDDLRQTFEDIEELAGECRFRDCQHQGEPFCAVQQAITEEGLDQGRLQNYHKMQRELRYTERKVNARARAQEQAKWKKITKAMRKNKKCKF